MGCRDTLPTTQSGSDTQRTLPANRRLAPIPSTAPELTGPGRLIQAASFFGPDREGIACLSPLTGFVTVMASPVQSWNLPSSSQPGTTKTTGLRGLSGGGWTTILEALGVGQLSSVIVLLLSPRIGWLWTALAIVAFGLAVGAVKGWAHRRKAGKSQPPLYHPRLVGTEGGVDVDSNKCRLDRIASVRFGPTTAPPRGWHPPLIGRCPVRDPRHDRLLSGWLGRRWYSLRLSLLLRRRQRIW